jgi:hypothetical protein
MICYVLSYVVIVLSLSIKESQAFNENPSYRVSLTSDIKDKEPVDDISSFSQDTKKVFFFTELNNCKGCYFRHVWEYEGNVVFIKNGQAKYNRYRYWSRVSMRNNFGKWKVSLYVNNELVKERKFTYTELVKKQDPIQGIQKRLEIKSVSECEEQSRYYMKKLEEYPNDPYYEFMLGKWVDRCLNKH